MRLTDVEIGERYLWWAAVPHSRKAAAVPIAEVEAVEIVEAEHYRVRRDGAARTHERRVVIRNIVNGITRVVPARHLQPMDAASPFEDLGAALRS